MAIYNLTAHGVSLYSASQIPAQPHFERTSGGWLVVGDRDEQGVFSGIGYSRWPQPGHGDGNPVVRPARVAELRSEVQRLEYMTSEYMEGPGCGPDGCGHGETPVKATVPVRTVTYGAITNLPAPEAGTFYIVSLTIVEAARREGRVTNDLLTMGDLVRDPKGEIVGVTSFYRW